MPNHEQTLPPLLEQTHTVLSNKKTFTETLPLWIRLCSYGNTLEELGTFLSNSLITWHTKQGIPRLVLLGLPNICTNTYSFFGKYASEDHTSFNTLPEHTTYLSYPLVSPAKRPLRPSQPIIIVQEGDDIYQLNLSDGLALAFSVNTAMGSQASNPNSSDQKLEIPSTIVLKSPYGTFLLANFPNESINNRGYRTPGLDIGDSKAYLNYELGTFYNTIGPLPRVYIELGYQHPTLGEFNSRHGQHHPEPTAPDTAIAQHLLLFNTLQMASAYAAQLNCFAQLGRHLVSNGFLMTINPQTAHTVDNALLVSTASQPPTITLSHRATFQTVSITGTALGDANAADAPTTLTLQLPEHLCGASKGYQNLYPNPWEPLSSHHLTCVLSMFPSNQLSLSC